MKPISRRDVLAFGGVAAASLLCGSGANAAGGFRLTARRRVIDVKGRAARVFGLESPAGFGGVTFHTSERFAVELRNELGEPTLIHWHGQTPPAEQDGVPDLSQAALSQGAGYSYDFAGLRAGTHWMHSHVALQEQVLLAAPLIVRDDADDDLDEQEHVVMLHDFTFRDPREILAELRAGKGAHAEHAMHGAALNDVTYDAYLANDRTLDDPQIVQVETGGRLRLRIINGAAASNMWIDLGRIVGQLVAVDGNPIEPVAGSLFPLAVAQRADIRLSLPGKSGAWPILFQPEGVRQRTGIILATAGAGIQRIDTEGDASPAVDLSLEANLRATRPPAPEPITRIEVVRLTGGATDYVWGFNGKPMMHETLFPVRMGERIAMIVHNETAMSHPMHLHGHHFRVIGIDGRNIAGAMRDTVLVPPKSAVTIAFDANNPGNWAFHCHHLYHMNSGMMAAIRYSTAA